MQQIRHFLACLADNGPHRVHLVFDWGSYGSVVDETRENAWI